jgi:hypothetical protein
MASRAAMARYLLRELPKTALRLVVAVTLFALVTQLPLPAMLGKWIGVAAAALLTAVVLMICGSLLYNTFYPLQDQHRTRYFYPRDRR